VRERERGCTCVGAYEHVHVCARVFVVCVGVCCVCGCVCMCVCVMCGVQCAVCVVCV